MSAVLTDRPAAGTTRRYDAEPRVQLLPPFVAQRAKARSSVRLGIMLVILGAVVAGGLFVLGALRVTVAQLALAEANTETQVILQQQAEYRIATDTAAMVAQTTETQLMATSYEIAWADLLRTIKGFVPEGGALQSFTATSQAPWASGLEIEDPLRTPRIATVEIVVDTVSIPDAVALAERLRAIDGFADAVVTTSAVGVDGRATTTISLTLSTDSVSGRFVVSDDEVAEGEETTSPAPDESATDDGGEG